MTKNNNKPIGVFDSGVGGLSVLKELLNVLPTESYLYYADSGNAPYGAKSSEQIIDYCVHITDFLLEKGCKIIVVACNTATSAAIQYLRANYAISFIGMEPAIKPAALATKTGNIGVLATKGTLEGRLFNETSRKFTNDVKVHIEVGEGLVKLVESNQLDTPEMKQLVEKYTLPMLAKSVDHIVLGCTHYPFFEQTLKTIVGEKVKIVNPAPAVAQHTHNVLERQALLRLDKNVGDLQLYSSGDTAVLQILIEEITQRTFSVIEL